MKIAIIGAGSTYTPELIEGIINYRDSLPVEKIDLMDIDERKLRIVGGLAQRMVAASPLKAETRLTMELDEALTGADFVLAQIRVGKLPARELDETIPLRFGLIGQETMGIGGFFKAQRTIPQLMHIADRMKALCPDAFLINFSNPSGIVAEALLNNADIRMMGMCNVPFNMKKSIGEQLGTSKDAFFEFAGLNHLTWVTSIMDGGVDRLAEAIDKGVTAESMKNIPAQGFAPELVRMLRAIPSPYLEYVYHIHHKLDTLQNHTPQCRAQRCMEIEEELLQLYQDNALHIKPKLLESRGGANYSLCAISLVNAIYNDLHEIHEVNVQAKGAVPYLLDSDVVEIAAYIDKNGATPIPLTHPGNEHIATLIQRWKAYEHYTVRAALTGDRDAAILALTTCPMINDYDAATACFDAMLEAHKRYLPQFAK